MNQPAVGSPRFNPKPNPPLKNPTTPEAQHPPLTRSISSPVFKPPPPNMKPQLPPPNTKPPPSLPTKPQLPPKPTTDCNKLPPLSPRGISLSSSAATPKNSNPYSASTYSNSNPVPSRHPHPTNNNTQHSNNNHNHNNNHNNSSLNDGLTASQTVEELVEVSATAIGSENDSESEAQEFLASRRFRWVGTQRDSITTPRDEDTSSLGEGDGLLTKEQRLRRACLRELLETEKIYYETLTVGIQAFVEPIRAENKLDESKVNIIFGNVEYIQKVSGELYQLLRERLGDDPPWDTAVGDLLCAKSAEFFLYKSYCANHPVANEAVQEALKNNEFSKFIAKCMENPICKNWNIAPTVVLSDYLIKPVQRICKYPLLLNEILKYTPTTLRDHADLNSALEKIKSLVDQVNSYSREVQNTLRVLQIKSHVDDCKDIVEPTRRFLREEMFHVINSSNKPRQIVAFALTDLLLVAKPKNKKYLDPSERGPSCFALKHKIKLREAVLKNIIMLHQEPTLNFKIEYPPGKQVIFQASSLEQKTSWMKMLQDLIAKQLFPRDSVGTNSSKAEKMLGMNDDKSVMDTPQPKPRISATVSGRISMGLSASTSALPVLRHRNQSQRVSGAQSEPSSPREEVSPSTEAHSRSFESPVPMRGTSDNELVSKPETRSRNTINVLPPAHLRNRASLIGMRGSMELPATFNYPHSQPTTTPLSEETPLPSSPLQEGAVRHFSLGGQRRITQKAADEP